MKTQTTKYLVNDSFEIGRYVSSHVLDSQGEDDYQFALYLSAILKNDSFSKTCITKIIADLVQKALKDIGLDGYSCVISRQESINP